ncbi:MAG: N-6 DNA methylase, partial [Chloroflexi bacterium]|nr:N-6 DNA methylase [Chloroflexota bacterium]
VRLSLVNLYLHRFPDPDVFEYDTLTSEERWNEYANVILANPPFMSPKGGIRPHNRFSVTSRRSEVLFVDYIAEHLTPEGRAGVIVPEGIIFQSQNAHKQLRKMLVEDYLVAVVSLPPGVFNPYSGVKTSILILDKSLARRSETIGFFKVENDGFDLGAQRREIDQNDLPRVKTEVVEYLRRVREGDGIGEFMPSTGMVVEKSRVGEDGDYNLSGERYRVSVVTAGRFPMAKLGDVAEYINGMAFKPSDWEQEGRKIIRIQNLTGTSSKYNFTTRQDILEKYVVKRGDLLISWSATIGFFIWDDDDAVLNQHIFRVAPNEAILKKYLYYCKDQISAAITENVHGNTMRHITKGRFENIDIPLPSLEVQREIVSEIEGYQRVIDGARAVVENWRPGIAVDPEWPVVELGEVCDVINGSTPSRKEPRYWDANDVPWFTVNDIRQIGRRIDRTQQSISKAALHESSLRLLPPKTVLLCCTASVGEYAISEIPLTTNQQFNGLVVKQEARPVLDPEFLFRMSAQFKDELIRLSGKTSFTFVSGRVLKRIRMPLPDLETQQAITRDLTAEQSLVDANVSLIERMEGKIRDVMGRVWGES